MQADTERCPLCGDRMKDRIGVQMTPRGDIHHVDRVCVGCGLVIYDDEGGEA